jgi:hypothetical protein
MSITRKTRDADLPPIFYDQGRSPADRANIAKAPELMCHAVRVQHGCDTMRRFSERVAYLIELLEADYLKRGQRERVDEMIWERKRMQKTPRFALRTKRRKFGLANFEPNCWTR